MFPIFTCTFRVLVSSTFEDLKAERDGMQRHVFPRLRRLCKAISARSHAIDMRWGVRDEAALDQQTMGSACARLKVLSRPASYNGKDRHAHQSWGAKDARCVLDDCLD